MDYQYQVPTVGGLTELLPRSEQVTIPKSMPDNPLEVLTDKQRLKLALKVFQAYAETLTRALNIYRPTPPAERFHASTARIRLISGPNRAGKTTGAMVELVRLFDGCDPYKKRKDRDLRMYSVGKDEKHLADPMLLKILWPGAFMCITDEETGLLRAVAYDPDNPHQVLPSDLSRQNEWKPAPALLTDRDVTVRWNKRGMGVPSKLEHKRNGSVWQWFTSKSDPRQGGEVDVFHCDEEVEKRGGKSWVVEGQMRTADRRGIQVYSFTPQAATPEYFEMHKRALRGEPGVEEFTITIDDNPFIPAESKRAMYEDLKHDPDELAVRYYGQYAITQRRVFPQYDPEIHRIDDIVIPHDWMRLMIVDPGAQFQGALFLAVRPEENEVHAYKEIYLRNKTAADLAEAIKPLTDQVCFEDFIIDKRGGQQTPMGHGNTIADHYSSELEKLNIASRLSGSQFHFGSDDVEGREGSLKRWLTHKPPLLKIHRRACPVLDSHLQNRQFSKADPRKRDPRQPHDLTDMLCYGCAWFDTYLDSPDHPYGLYYSIPVEPSILSPDERLTAEERAGLTEDQIAKLEKQREEQKLRDQRIYSAFLKHQRNLPKPDRGFSYGQHYRPQQKP